LIEKFHPHYIAGGATQNTIRVAQWLLPHGSTTYIGSVGKDAHAEQLRKSAHADGVHTHYYEDSKAPTGTCAVLIHNKERSLIANLAAANNYNSTHLLRPDSVGLWLKAEVIYSAGFFLTVAPDAALLLAKHAFAAHKIYATNISAPFIADFFTEPLMAVVPYADFLFGNESEAKALGKKLGYEETTVEGIAARVAKLPKQGKPRHVVFTQGAEPTIVATAEGTHSYPVPPLRPDQIVDVNGAGDAFVGGFLAAIIKGKSVEVAVHTGHYTASVILSVSGCVVHGKPDHKWL